MSKRAASPKISLSWQLKIEVLDVTPTVWRRLIVPETIKLPKLDRAIHAAFGWTNSDLHEFIIGGVRYAYPLGFLACALPLRAYGAVEIPAHIKGSSDVP